MLRPRKRLNLVPWFPEKGAPQSEWQRWDQDQLALRAELDEARWGMRPAVSASVIAILEDDKRRSERRTSRERTAKRLAWLVAAPFLLVYLAAGYATLGLIGIATAGSVVYLTGAAAGWWPGP